MSVQQVGLCLSNRWVYVWRFGKQVEMNDNQDKKEHLLAVCVLPHVMITVSS